MSGARRLLSASADASVKLWGDSDSPLATLSGHEMSVNTVDWSSEASVVVSGSRDCTLRLWDAQSSREVGKAKVLRNVVTSLRVCPGRNAVVQCSEDLRIRVWSTSSGSLREEAKISSGPNQLICCDVCPDGNYVIAGSKGFSRENCQLHLYDLRHLREVVAVPSFDQTIEGVAWLNSTTVLAASKDCHVRTFAVQGFQEIQELNDFGPEANPFTCCCLLENGNVAVGGSGPHISILQYSAVGRGGPSIVAGM
mmetsp:Transcript_76414/g.175056  ORF Transcript_76414/g.175056 Transcript_76414/m.175056 type:complete len:253 (+) Transcript_76414:341-1099(+)